MTQEDTLPQYVDVQYVDVQGVNDTGRQFQWRKKL